VKKNFLLKFLDYLFSMLHLLKLRCTAWHLIKIFYLFVIIVDIRCLFGNSYAQCIFNLRSNKIITYIVNGWLIPFRLLDAYIIYDHYYNLISHIYVLDLEIYVRWILLPPEVISNIVFHIILRSKLIFGFEYRADSIYINFTLNIHEC